MKLCMSQRVILHCIEGESRSRAELARTTLSLGHHAEVYASVDELAEHRPGEGILVVRDNPQTGGIAATIERLDALGLWLPVVAADSQPTTSRIVEAMRAGALDYLLLPVDRSSLAAMLDRIAEPAQRQLHERQRKLEARGRIASLSQREREVLEWLSEGSSNKAIARELDISPRTVEIHRANMMHKLGARHAAEAVRLRIEAQIESPNA